MKKLLFLSVLILILALSPACHAEGTDTLVNWGIQVAVPDDATAVLEGDEYYIYAQETGYIPYVMLRPYRYSSADSFLSDFTDFMKQQYSDLQVTQDISSRQIGDKPCLETDYSYSISGYAVRDRRIAVRHGELVYMFCSKEVDGMTLGNMLEDVVASCRFTDSSPSAYLYCIQGGMPKYWLDFSGPDVILHCWFRSSDPTFYESFYTLDMDTAEEADGQTVIHKVSDSHGFDRSDWFRNLRFYPKDDMLVLEVERDEATLAGGSESILQTGEYWMEPMRVGTADGKAILLPLRDGPYTPDELGRLAQIRYFTNTGFYPPYADTDVNQDGSFTIHLYEVVMTDGVKHTATSAWYTVDACGVGANDITGEAIDLAGVG